MFHTNEQLIEIYKRQMNFISITLIFKSNENEVQRFLCWLVACWLAALAALAALACFNVCHAVWLATLLGWPCSGLFDFIVFYAVTITYN